MNSRIRLLEDDGVLYDYLKDSIIEDCDDIIEKAKEWKLYVKSLESKPDSEMDEE